MSENLTAEELAEAVVTLSDLLKTGGPNGRYTRAISVVLTALEEAEGRITEALTMTGCRDLADLIDMANVGKSMMDRMAEVTADGPLKGWAPADDPAEIVTDLRNALDDALHDYGNAESEAKGAEADIADLTARAEKAEQQVKALEKLLGVETINGVRGYCCHDHCSCGGDPPAIRQTCGSWFTLYPSKSEADNGVS